MRTVAIVQARVGSTRLPGKVLLPLAGEPLLARVVQRIRGSRSIDEVVVATTWAGEDDAIRELCTTHDVPCFTGHPDNLIDRHLRAAQAHGADVVVKIPSDCPLIDPRVIDSVLASFVEAADADYCSNLHPPTWPDGQDVEAMTIDVLHRAWLGAGLQFEREHTTPYIWERPAEFRLLNVSWETGLDYSMTHRWTIDYPEDYDLIRTVYDRLHTSSNSIFSVDDILALVDSDPTIGAINAHLVGVNWYRHHLAELHTIEPSMTRVAP